MGVRPRLPPKLSDHEASSLDTWTPYVQGYQSFIFILGNIECSSQFSYHIASTHRNTHTHSLLPDYILLFSRPQFRCIFSRKLPLSSQLQEQWGVPFHVPQASYLPEHFSSILATDSKTLEGKIESCSPFMLSSWDRA